MKFVVDQALQEIRDQLRGLLVPVTFLGVVAFQLIMLTGAENARELTVLGVPMNSPYWLYRWSTGQALWMNFIFAWVFSRALLRDREAVLHEIVLASPAPIRLLIAARYLGAIAVAVFLASAPIVSFLLISVLAGIGLVPSELVGPVPGPQMLWTVLFLTTPTVIGVGAACLVGTIVMRGVSGAFAAGALLTLIWLIAVAVLNGAELAPGLASVIEPWGYAHVSRITDDWTIQEKMTRIVSMEGLLLANRLFWIFVPLAALGVALAGLRREDLLAEKAKKTPPKSGAVSAAMVARPVRRAAQSWLIATFQEARWQSAQTLRKWGFWLTFGFVVIIGCASVYMQLLVRPDGPFYPYANTTPLVLLGATLGFVYMYISAITGMIVRRDERRGFQEIVDATPALLGVLVVGKAFAALAVTAVITLTTPIAIMLLTLDAPGGLQVFDPLVWGVLLMIPGNLQVCILAFLIHVFIRRAGTAYSLSIILALFAAINHENELISHPLVQFTVPVHAIISELMGWAPWLPHAFVGGLARLAVVGIFLALAWVLWRRGVEAGMKERFALAFQRIPGGAGVVGAACLAVTAVTGAIIHRYTVELGRYTYMAEEYEEAATVEKAIDGNKGAFTIESGAASVFIDVGKTMAKSKMRLHGFVAKDGVLHGDLPHGARIVRAAVNGIDAELETVVDHFTMAAADCVDNGCIVDLELEVDGRYWPWDEVTTWLNSSSAWFRASDVLPSLGLDPTRYLRVPSVRKRFGLGPTPPTAPALALSPLNALAPGETWTWTVEFSEKGVSTPLSGTLDGPLDFAIGWRRNGEFLLTEGDGLTVTHGPRRAQAASEILQDVADMRHCVADTLGTAPDIVTIGQAPRMIGDIALHGSFFWIPEDDGWDSRPEGPSRHLRRFDIGRAIAARALAYDARLRDEEGARWLTSGAAGWVAMSCVREANGAEAWRTVLNLKGYDITAELGATLTPVTRVSAALDDPWADVYMAYSTAVWAEQAGRGAAAEKVRAVAANMRAGGSAADAMRRALGGEVAGELLGPPSASNIVITGVNPDGSASFSARRWVWRNGGWVETAPEHKIVQRFDDEEKPISLVRTDMPAIDVRSSEAFTLLPGEPGFERVLSDNIWMPDSQKRPEPNADES
ncbi:MAG: hypothetical protein MI755_09955 [Sphingomonadales bacterium]|nr:hypothetical protein [Sphingomonadales bacterium]